MLNFSLPVYALRAYDVLFQEGEYIVIQTRFTRYVLDNPSLPGTFSQRRFFLYGERENLPYKLYPLKKQFKYLSQIINSGLKHFIDSTGKIVTWKPTTYYNIITERVRGSTRIFNGKYQCYVKNVPYPFLLSEPANYISYALVRGSPVIFDTHEEEPETPRLRVKI